MGSPQSYFYLSQNQIVFSQILLVIEDPQGGGDFCCRQEVLQALHEEKLETITQ